MNAKDQKILDGLRIRPCKRGLAFLGDFDSLSEAWDACPIGGWLWWSLEAFGIIAGGTSEGHTCRGFISKPNRKCKRCRQWADELRAAYKCPVPRRRKAATK